MASAPSEPRSVRGRLDRDGRLVSADAELEALQVDAGSRVGARLAIPQIASIARLARSLGIPVTRPAVAADREHDLDLWVRAEPRGEFVELTIEGWTARPAAVARLASVAGNGEHAAANASFEWTADAELRLTSISGGLAKLVGIDSGEAVGKSLMRLFRLEAGEDGEMPLVSAVAARLSFAGQNARPRASDSAPMLVLSADVVKGADGGFAGFAGRATALEPVADGGDPTAHSAAERFDEALDEALRTPLDRIIDCAEQIAAGADGPLRRDYLDYATDISAAAKHLLSVVESMQEQPSTENDSVDLAALAAEAVVMLEPMAEECGIAFVLETTRSLRAKGEERGVIQVLVNLISNAVRHSPRGGKVLVRASREDGHAVLEVVDEGPGIPPGEAERVFERFYRSDQARSSEEGGSGLGLAIARWIVELHGGTIRAEDADPHGCRIVSCTWPATRLPPPSSRRSFFPTG